MPRISLVTHGFFFVWRLPITWFADSSTAELNVSIVWSMSRPSPRTRRGVNFPPIMTLEESATSGSLKLSQANFSQVLFGLLVPFRRVRKVIFSNSWSLPTSDPGKLLILAMLMTTGIFSVLRCSELGCDVLHLDGALRGSKKAQSVQFFCQFFPQN